MASDNKYDRQLRLWGASGQKALSEARVCLLNATAAGCEALKNLVLPGVGFVAIVDAVRVTAGDVANNFFVTAEDVGRPRGEVSVCEGREANADANANAEREPVRKNMQRTRGAGVDRGTVTKQELRHDMRAQTRARAPSASCLTPR